MKEIFRDTKTNQVTNDGKIASQLLDDRWSLEMSHRLSSAFFFSFTNYEQHCNLHWSENISTTVYVSRDTVRGGSLQKTCERADGRELILFVSWLLEPLSMAVSANQCVCGRTAHPYGLHAVCVRRREREREYYIDVWAFMWREN